MYDDEATEVIAEFTTDAEAEAALARLRERGINGKLANAESSSLFGGMPFAAIQLTVVASQADQARQLLAAEAAEPPEAGWEEAAESAIDGWICAGCDTVVPLDEEVCFECGGNRADARAKDEGGEG